MSKALVMWRNSDRQGRIFFSCMVGAALVNCAAPLMAHRVTWLTPLLVVVCLVAGVSGLIEGVSRSAKRDLERLNKELDQIIERQREHVMGWCRRCHGAGVVPIGNNGFGRCVVCEGTGRTGS